MERKGRNRGSRKDKAKARDSATGMTGSQFSEKTLAPTYSSMDCYDA